jgi:protein SCO1/2
MDHSAVTYLMGPDGTFLTHFSHGVAAQEMADTLARFVP